MSHHISLDKRLIDYYFVVTASDRAKSGTNQRLTSEPLAPKGAMKAVHAKFAWKPKIVDRYPAHDHADTPLRAWVARSSLPRGVRARTRPPPPRFTTFIGWNVDGCKLYGAVIEVYEKLKIRNQNEKVYMPKALGFLSHYPYFYAFDVFLRCLWHSIPKEIIRLEDLLVHYFYDIPVPAPGKKIAYDLGKLKVLLTQRNEFDIPIPELSQDILFSRLSEDRICWILRALLLGQRVIFVASQEGELTIVNETFCSLLFPLRWCYLYVPIASKHVALSLASYDGPFMVGLPLFLYKRDEVKSRLPRDAMIVEMDNNRILSPMTGHDDDVHAAPVRSRSRSRAGSPGPRRVMTGAPTPDLPMSILPELKKGIHALARILTMPIDEDNARPNRNQILAALRVCFNVVRYTISNAAAYLRDPDSHEHEQDKYSLDDIEFFTQFGHTKMYRSFVDYYHRVNPDDVEFRKIYQFFKTHEALGKDFARPAAGSMNVSFDRRVYNSKTFMVDRKLIAKLESQYAARRRGNTSTTPRSRATGASRDAASLIPIEFRPDPHVMAFLQRTMLNPNPHTVTQSSGKQPSESIASDGATTSISLTSPLMRGSGGDGMGTDMEPVGVGMSGHGHGHQSDDEPKGGGSNYNQDRDELAVHNGSGHYSENEPSQSSGFEEYGQSNGNNHNRLPMTRTASESMIDDGDATENMVVDLSDLASFHQTQPDYDSMSDWSLSEESGADIDDIEAWETESVLSDVDQKESGGSRGRTHRNRSSNTSIRSMQRFRHLNEFELSEEEYRNFRKCEKEHNVAVQGVHPSVFAVLGIVGSDLFTREIMEAWANNERNALKKSKSYHSGTSLEHQSLSDRDRERSLTDRRAGSVSPRSTSARSLHAN